MLPEQSFQTPNLSTNTTPTLQRQHTRLLRKRNNLLNSSPGPIPRQPRNNSSKQRIPRPINTHNILLTQHSSRLKKTHINPSNPTPRRRTSEEIRRSIILKQTGIIALEKLCKEDAAGAEFGEDAWDEREKLDGLLRDTFVDESPGSEFDQTVSRA